MSVVERKIPEKPDAEVSAIEKELVIFRGNLEAEYKRLEESSQEEIASDVARMDALAARTLEKTASGWVEKEEQARTILSDMEVSLHDMFERFLGDIGKFDSTSMVNSLFETTCASCKIAEEKSP